MCYFLIFFTFNSSLSFQKSRCSMCSMLASRSAAWTCAARTSLSRPASRTPHLRRLRETKARAARQQVQWNPKHHQVQCGSEQNEPIDWVGGVSPLSLSHSLFYSSSCTGVTPFQVSPSVFMVPAHYHQRGGSRLPHTHTHTPANHDEELLQYAIHQSLLESNSYSTQVCVCVSECAFVCVSPCVCVCV